MTGPRVELTLWAGAIASLFAAGLGWRYGVPRPALEPPPSLAGARVPLADGADTLTKGERAVEFDPFRLARRPPAVTYRPELEGMPPPPPPPPKPPKPPLALSGVVGGPPWTALIEGIPGRERSALVRQGDTLSGLTIKRVGRDTVTVVGMDTTWRLIVRRAWQ